MKPTLALLFLAPLALAQTKPAVHHTATHRTTSACPAGDTQPTLPLTVPKVAGCTRPLYTLSYIDTVVGTGAPITPRKWLTVNYTGYLKDGTKFDSSIGKDPITFPYGAHQVIPGWDTGFEGMNIGGHRRLFIPYQLAYGEAGRAPVIPAKAELIFDIELVAISDTPPAPKTPPAPPAGTKPPVPPAGTAQPSTPPAKPATDPSAAQSTVGKPTTTPAPPTTTAPTDPTKPAAVPPK